MFAYWHYFTAIVSAGTYILRNNLFDCQGTGTTTTVQFASTLSSSSFFDFSVNVVIAKSTATPCYGLRSTVDHSISTSTIVYQSNTFWVLGPTVAVALAPAALRYSTAPFNSSTTT